MSRARQDHARQAAPGDVVGAAEAQRRYEFTQLPPAAAEETSMAAQHAHTLQQHALDSLGELRSWLGARSAELTPVGATAAASQAESQAAYAAWAAQVDAVLRAVGRAFPECEKQRAPALAPGSLEPEPAPESSPPTLPSHRAEHSISRA
ncbi:MAG: hypothetical protein RL033_6598 [Pseudomonadota bacterium]